VERLPFDPAKMKPAPPPTKPAGDAALTVSQLAARIDGVLRTLPSGVRVTGEVSGFRDRTHWYFDLKDADAVVNCVMFASAARRAGFTPANGQAVVVKGRVEFYAKGGKVSFLVDSMQPVGEGALDAAFRKLCEDLRGRGWFDIERKRPLPMFPRRVAVVTSRTGAALQDVLVTMKRRCPAVDVLVVDVRVQGDGAAAEVAEAIRVLNAKAAAWAIDAILVTRGGGSKEDLWAFNELAVAEAIVHSRVPVVAAIGHETDTTIAELVADERCATPTQAAMRLTPDRAALQRQLAAMLNRLSSGMERMCRDGGHEAAHEAMRLQRGVERRIRAASDELTLARRRLDRLHPRVRHADTVARLATLAARLGDVVRTRLARDDVEPMAQRLSRAMVIALARGGERVHVAARQLEAVSPTRVLERGFSLTTDARGAAIRDGAALRAGDELVTTFARGTVKSMVVGDSAKRDKPRVTVNLKPAGEKRDGRTQMGLF